MTIVDIPSPRPAPTDPAAEAWALVVRAQAGDRDAFGDLYRRYNETVTRFVRGRLTGRHHVVEDLVSDTFLKAFRSIGSFRWQGRDPAAWLITIARNLLADHFKSAHSRLSISVSDNVEFDRADDAPEADPAAAVVDQSVSRVLVDAMAVLTDDQRRCVELRFFDGLNVSETAAVMGIKAGACKALQYRAVRAMARLVPELEEVR